MSEDFQLLEDDTPKPQGRCSRCKLDYGKTKPENESLLRCPECDFPFGETADAMRAIALGLQRLGERVNVYSQPVCYIWLKVVRDGLDLGVEAEHDVETFGEVPEWYAFEMDSTDWESVIGPEWKSRTDESNFTGTWNDWALQEGFSPGQRFLIEFKHPRWYRCSWEYEEYDVEYYWDIVLREPRTPKQAIRAWKQWRKVCEEAREGCRLARAAQTYKRQHDVDAMYIQHDSFWSQGYYDDCSPPDGYIVRLCSSHGGGGIAEGRSPTYDERYKRRDSEPMVPSRERAWEALIADVQKRLPHLDVEVIRKLSTRY